MAATTACKQPEAEGAVSQWRSSESTDVGNRSATVAIVIVVLRKAAAVLKKCSSSANGTATCSRVACNYSFSRVVSPLLLLLLLLL